MAELVKRTKDKVIVRPKGDWNHRGKISQFAGVLLALTIPARRLIDTQEFLDRGRSLLQTFSVGVKRGKSAPSADQSDVIHALEEACENVETPLYRMEHALHGWVNRSIRHAGRQGSRDGTLKVLKRGFGRCGDSADVLITLARAAGLPARLVAGWVVGLGGHFWAEVHIPRMGWVSVDAATVPANPGMSLKRR